MIALKTGGEVASYSCDSTNITSIKEFELYATFL